LLVHETIQYDFGRLERHGIFRDIPVRFDYPPKRATDRVFPLDVVSVKAAPGTPSQYTTEDFSSNGVGYERIKIGDPHRTIEGVHTYEITYVVRGALNGFSDHDELVWNAVGTQWSVPIATTTVRLSAPAAIQQVNCSQGSFGSSLPCKTAQSSGSQATFTQGLLGPFAGVTVSIAIPKGAVPRPRPVLEERFTLDRAFALTPVTGAASGGLLVVLVGGFLAFFVPRARDRRYRGSAVDAAYGTKGAPEEAVPLFEHTETPVEFVPPDGLRPGQVGTLVDFTANPLDVTATIVDLAVRKHLVIEETETESRWMKNDWTLTKLDAPAGDTPAPYEQQLLDGIFQSDVTVELSGLKNHFAARMRGVQQALLDDAMARGWFTRKPGTATGIAFAVAIFALVAGVALTIALAVLTHAALVGVPFVILGIVMLVAARYAPSRTATGSATLRHVDGFRRFIEESEKERARFAERKNLFSEYLPYAIVFGATEKWAKAFAGLDGELPDTSWYRSSLPFQYLAFSSAMHGFTVTTAGTLTSTPPSTSGSSGFSGGGFSGGGGGGGGGGSW
jgi:uncharacterized membrane protein YgcG